MAWNEAAALKFGRVRCTLAEIRMVGWMDGFLVIKNNYSCKIEDFIGTQLCKLCVILMAYHELPA